MLAFGHGKGAGAPHHPGLCPSRSQTHGLVVGPRSQLWIPGQRQVSKVITRAPVP